MKKERTLAIVLPSCMRYMATILEKIEEKADLRIVKSVTFQFSAKQAEEFCAIFHKENLVKVLSYSTVKVLCLEGENAIEKWQNLMGPEDPNAHDAEWWQLRCMLADGAAYAGGNPDNGFYGSETVEEAKRGLDFVFGPRGLIRR